MDKEQILIVMQTLAKKIVDFAADHVVCPFCAVVGQDNAQHRPGCIISWIQANVPPEVRGTDGS